jgi:hypothetical protein
MRSIMLPPWCAAMIHANPIGRPGFRHGFARVWRRFFGVAPIRGMLYARSALRPASDGTPRGMPIMSIFKAADDRCHHALRAAQAVLAVGM